MCQSGIVVSVG